MQALPKILSNAKIQTAFHGQGTRFCLYGRCSALQTACFMCDGPHLIEILIGVAVMRRWMTAYGRQAGGSGRLTTFICLPGRSSKTGPRRCGRIRYHGRT
jgi:hypothetical protein